MQHFALRCQLLIKDSHQKGSEFEHPARPKKLLTFIILYGDDVFSNLSSSNSSSRFVERITHRLLSQWRDLRIWSGSEDLGAATTTRARLRAEGEGQTEAPLLRVSAGL